MTHAGFGRPDHLKHTQMIRYIRNVLHKDCCGTLKLSRESRNYVFNEWSRVKNQPHNV